MKSYFASLALTLLSLSIVSSIAIVSSNNASAQEDQERGFPGGLEREQRGDIIPGQQPADIGGPALLNRTIIEGDDSGAQPSACAPAQTAGGGQNATTTGGDTATADMNATSATTAGDGGSGNQSTTSSPIQLIEQACMSLQSGDTQGALMQLNSALSQLRGGTQGNMTSTTGGNATITGGSTDITTGPGGVGTDDPSASDNPFSDLT